MKQYVLPAAIGVVAAALTTFLSAWVTSRREHKAWLRQSRREAYVDFLAAKDAYILGQLWPPVGRAESDEERAERERENARLLSVSSRQLTAAHAAVAIVGPPDVASLAQQFVDNKVDRDAFISAASRQLNAE